MSHARTSQEWWARTRDNPEALTRWLVQQYRGEVTAAERIGAFAERHAAEADDPERARRALESVAADERKHASWVLDLCRARGITPDVAGAEARYWRETLPAVESFATGAAVGAHAEAMRLERIRVIAADNNAPADIRETFGRILGDEIRHERIFARLAGPEALAATADAAARGREVLGLTP